MADLQSKTYDELYELAQEADVQGRTKMDKDELIAALSASDADAESAAATDDVPAAAGVPLTCYGCGAVNLGVDLSVGSANDWTCAECGRKQAVMVVAND